MYVIHMTPIYFLTYTLKQLLADIIHLLYMHVHIRAIVKKLDKRKQSLD